jgi:quinol monooxygenase YgiN
MAKTVVVISHIRARRGNEAIVRDTLKKLIVPTRAEEGCLDYKFFESAADATLFVS